MIIDCYHYPKIYFSLLLFLIPCFAFCQSNYQGKVTDKNNNPISYASIQVTSMDGISTYTDTTGYFKFEDLNHKSTELTILVSAIGYKSMTLNILSNREQVIQLRDESFVIDEVEIIRPFREFTSINLNKLDIYTNPLAGADALNALQIYAYSTNVDESANPSFRGSEADKSRVFINNVPITNPVRNSQINGIGNFSIFNTELINSVDVYPGNPPLIYGNTSAGLVDIKTSNQVSNNYKVNLSVAGVGGMINRNLGKSAFVQVYANSQFPGALIALNKDGLKFLKDFKTDDLGVNSRIKLTNKSSLNIYSYLINEKSEVETNINFIPGIANSSKKRGFLIANYQTALSDNLKLGINASLDQSRSQLNFNRITVQSDNKTWYGSTELSYQKNNLQISAGINYNEIQNEFDGTFPTYYYSNHDSSSTTKLAADFKLPILESYAYSTYKSKAFIFSLGLRKNIPTDIASALEIERHNYFSFQSYVRWNISNANNLILSAGQYHNYSEPNLLYLRQALNKSTQYALDYNFSKNASIIKASFYYKTENGYSNSIYDFLESEIAKRKIYGTELSIEQGFWKNFKWLSSFTAMSSTFRADNTTYHSSNSLPYFFKNSISFSKNMFTVALTSLNRPGTSYTPIVDALYVPEALAFEPIYQQTFNSKKLTSYNRIDMNMSKLIPIKKNLLTVYLSVNNIFNIKNQRNIIYDNNYSEQAFEHFNGRVVFFGMTFAIN